MFRGGFRPCIWNSIDKRRIDLPSVYPKGSDREEVEKARRLALRSARDFQDKLRSGTSVAEALASMRADAVQRKGRAAQRTPCKRAAMAMAS
mmetsp:Transcript_58319/g.139005  ORF Transcript_58319/g.139005 Transcript_58319/m.139005 type:complete len:92 (+) Transcript_58319:227-502(+)